MPQTRRHAVETCVALSRLETMSLVTLTGGAGFVAAFLLLRGGVRGR